MSVHLAKGARDFLPAAMRNRLAVIGIVREVFERFGFEPLDTPAFERLETLAGKYGDEGDKLMYKILKRGRGSERGECDMALRYDLTVPLARVVAMHPELRMPFKRYHMAPVWRADRPQRGRFREFWQCDVDVVGTTSPLAEAECLAVVDAAMEALGFSDFRIRLNDRRILRAMARAAGAMDQEMPVLIAVDKLDKIGRDGVTAELAGLGLEPDAVARLWQILDVKPGLQSTLDALAPQLDEEGQAGVQTLREVLALAAAHGVPSHRIVVDPTLARGLDYYTGPVYECEVLEGGIGSTGGGGRYDGLVGLFSGRDIPAVGVSLGLERLITVMEERGMLPAEGATAQVLVTLHGPEQQHYAVKVATTLRNAGVRTELFLDSRKLRAQFKHANACGHGWIALSGPDEANNGQVTLKNMSTGAQQTVRLEDAAGIVLG